MLCAWLHYRAQRGTGAILSAMQTVADPKFMRMAIALATENVRSGKGGPFGAVVVRDGEVIAAEANSVTSTNDPTAHAEVNAIRAACAKLGTFQLDGCDVYTSCEPCPMCLAALYWSRCRTIFYGNTAADAAAAGFDDGFLYEEINRPMNERRIPISRVLGDEALESFEAWTVSNERIDY
jgi:tRNA(Arg) A34 adenosine deaminase TadA